MKKIILFSLIIINTTLFSQSWVQIADFPEGRHHPVTFSLEGKGYSFTGTRFDNRPTNSGHQYNPDSNSWRQIANFPGLARSFAISVTTNNKAYMGFGLDGSNRLLNDLWEFNPTDSSWTQLASCPCSGRRHPAMIASGNRIYVGLGDGAFGNLADFWRYDITSNTWIQISNIPGLPRHHPFMFNAGGNVFAGMGHGNGPGINIYNDWYKLDTVSNNWITMSNFPGEARVAGTQFSHNGFGYVLSGDGDNHTFMRTGEIWQYNPNIDSWNQLTPHPGTSRWAPGNFVIDDEVYFFGGLNRVNGQLQTDAWKFNLPDSTMNDTTISVDEISAKLINTYAYPNPAKNILNWENDNSINHIKIYSSLGKLIFEGPSSLKSMDVSPYNDGLYFIQFFENVELLKTSKIIIQNNN